VGLIRYKADSEDLQEENERIIPSGALQPCGRRYLPLKRNRSLRLHRRLSNYFARFLRSHSESGWSDEQSQVLQLAPEGQIAHGRLVQGIVCSSKTDAKARSQWIRRSLAAKSECGDETMTCSQSADNQIEVSGKPCQNCEALRARWKHIEEWTRASKHSDSTEKRITTPVRK